MWACLDVGWDWGVFQTVICWIPLGFPKLCFLVPSKKKQQKTMLSSDLLFLMFTSSEEIIGVLELLLIWSVFTFRYAGSCFPCSMVVCKVKHKSFKSSKWRSQWPTLTLEQWGQTADSPCCTRRSNRKLWVVVGKPTYICFLVTIGIIGTIRQERTAIRFKWLSTPSDKRIEETLMALTFDSEEDKLWYW